MDSPRQTEKWKLLASTVAVLAVGCVVLRAIAPVKISGLSNSKRPILASLAKGKERVHYENPHTGRVSNYELPIDRDAHGVVQRIIFPKGGWKEIHGAATPNGNGTETYTDDHGARYTVNVSATVDSMAAVYGVNPVATKVTKPALATPSKHG